MTFSNRTYLDHNASAPMLEPVRRAMIDALALTGNASSVHEEGREARKVIEQARKNVALLVGAEPASVIFTSGGTEANQMALLTGWRDQQRNTKPLEHLFVSTTEHPSVLAGGGFEASQISQLLVDSDGVLDLNFLKQSLANFCRKNPDSGFVVSVMAANNETGVLQPVGDIAQIVQEFGGIFHSDFVQFAGKERSSMDAARPDLISLSAHKLGGPHGVGALVLKSANLLCERPLLRGGGQETWRRAGTENVAGIAGFGVAAIAARENFDDWPRIAELRDKMEEQLTTLSDDVVIFSRNRRRLGNTTCFAVPGAQAETLVISLDLADVAVSAGSACSSGKVQQSHVLAAMGVEEQLNRAAIRVSLGLKNSAGDIEKFLYAWGAILKRQKQKQAAA